MQNFIYIRMEGRFQVSDDFDKFGCKGTVLQVNTHTYIEIGPPTELL